MRSRSILAAILVVAGCSPSSRAAPPSTAPPATAGTAVDGVSSPMVAASPAPDPALATAMSRWAETAPMTYAYTVQTTHPGLATTIDRVVTLEGHTERVALLTASMSGWPDASLTIAGLFALAGGAPEAGSTRATYDAALGYPTTIEWNDPAASDGSFSLRVHAFRFLDHRAGGAAQPDLSTQLVDARRAWRPTASLDYAYDWRRVAANADPAGGVTWSVIHVDGASSMTPGAGTEPAGDPGVATVPATLDAIGSASEAGAWVEAIIDGADGVPVLVAVDPSPAAGDGEWIRIAFRDVSAERSRAALDAARQRWTAGRPARYSYVWTEVTERTRWTYRISMTGDVAEIHRSPRAPIGEAAQLAPRIDDLFGVIENILVSGGHVDGIYDPDLGFPVRVTLDASEFGPAGTITIDHLVIHDAD